VIPSSPPKGLPVLDLTSNAVTSLTLKPRLSVLFVRVHPSTNPRSSLAPINQASSRTPLSGAAFPFRHRSFHDRPLSRVLLPSLFIIRPLYIGETSFTVFGPGFVTHLVAFPVRIFFLPNVVSESSRTLCDFSYVSLTCYGEESAVLAVISVVAVFSRDQCRAVRTGAAPRFFTQLPDLASTLPPWLLSDTAIL